MPVAMCRRLRHCCGTWTLLLGVLGASGCVHPVDPHHATVDAEALDLEALSGLLLTRRVVAVETTERTDTYGVKGERKSASRSRFGSPGRVADPACIVAGIRGTFPAARIVPTETFWTGVAPGRDTIALGEIRRPEARRRFEDQGLEVIVAAHHRRVDLESGFMEALIEGGVTDRDRETAAVAVVDMVGARILAIDQLEYEDQTVVAHAFVVVPLAGFTNVTTDPCEGAGGRAGEALATRFGERPVGLVVVATEDNHYTVARRGP